MHLERNLCSVSFYNVLYKFFLLIASIPSGQWPSPSTCVLFLQTKLETSANSSHRSIRFWLQLILKQKYLY
ncbi:hypothetical protein V6N12_011480 [Hibiscus sabdariffa]|uniref:Uncharacterized protein n=1 Tax=Hibiscus sabdariffa TaxID=183260 RepID=A0ABR2BPJ6_9ROSI